MIRIATALIALSVAGLASAQETPNPTALLHVDSGTVQVQGAEAVSEGSVGVNPGDVVVIDGSATVTYPNGCTATVSGQYTMPAVAPTCTPEKQPIQGDGKWVAAGVAGAVALGAAVSGGGDGGSDKPSSP